MNWELLYRFGFLEVWKTPTRYLVCYHYGLDFRFKDSLNECLEEIKNWC